MSKTISINPELFKLNKSKTKKNKPSIPTISSSLRSKFLKKVSQSKNKVKNSSPVLDNTDNEFEQSMEYLNEVMNEKKKELVHNKTIKQPHNPIRVMTELSPELSEVSISEPANTYSLKLNYQVDQDVPYGCLKNGNKPNYRTWMKTKKNNNISILEPFEENRKETEQEKEKEKEQVDEPIPIFKKMDEPIPIFKKIETPILELEHDDLIEDFVEPIEESIPQPIQPMQEEIIEVPVKKEFRKTIKKKYTLGKSKIYRNIGVLLKNKTIKQQVINAHKNLKNTDIKNIKKYLLEKGLVKIGNNATHDVLREMYENVKLTGDVTNTNKETLLYNFINEKE